MSKQVSPFECKNDRHIRLISHAIFMKIDCVHYQKVDSQNIRVNVTPTSSGEFMEHM